MVQNVLASLSKVWFPAVKQLFEALHSKPEGRGLDSRWCHWNYSLAWHFLRPYGPGVDPDSYKKWVPGIFNE